MLGSMAKRQQKCNFDNFDNTPDAKEAIKACQEWVESYKQGETDGLILTGPKGTGKTHLLAAMCNQLSKSEYYWAPVSEFLSSLQPDSAIQELRKKAINCWTSCYGRCGSMGYKSTGGALPITCQQCPGIAGDPMERAMSAKVLVLDDLGTRANNERTDWVQDRIFALINYRYDEQLPVLVSTNYSLAELADRLGHERIVSRLIEMCRIVKIEGDDYRIGLRMEKNAKGAL